MQPEFAMLYKRHADYPEKNVKIRKKSESIVCNLRMELTVRSGPETGDSRAPGWAAGTCLLLVLQEKDNGSSRALLQ